MVRLDPDSAGRAGVTQEVAHWVLGKREKGGSWEIPTLLAWILG